MSTDGALRVDFYVLDGTADAARLKLACRLAEKAWSGAHRTVVAATDAAELQRLDELLWTYSDGSFVPHETAAADAAAPQPEVRADTGPQPTPPVLLCVGALPAGEFDVLVNLAPELPPWRGRVRRIAEVVDAEEGRRQHGRARFKAYRDLGITPTTHNLRGD